MFLPGLPELWGVTEVTRAELWAAIQAHVILWVALTTLSLVLTTAGVLWRIGWPHAPWRSVDARWYWSVGRRRPDQRLRVLRTGLREWRRGTEPNTRSLVRGHGERLQGMQASCRVVLQATSERRSGARAVTRAQLEVRDIPGLP